jgi:queuine tRNA-ribosyltransferase
VGEAPEVMYGVIDAIAAEMPAERPRYLMGVGTPQDIWTGIAAGIDMFDCVMPTRNARNGQLFVRAGFGEPGGRGGRLNIANAQYRDDPKPVEDGCPCECCSTYSRGYLAHLFRAEELLFHRLASIHNLQHYLSLARRAREAIVAGGAFPASPW